MRVVSVSFGRNVTATRETCQRRFTRAKELKRFNNYRHEISNRKPKRVLVPRFDSIYFDIRPQTVPEDTVPSLQSQFAEIFWEFR